MMATLTFDAPHSSDARLDAMLANSKPPDLSSGRWDYAASSDDLLVVFARKINDRRAIQMLIDRHFRWLERLIEWEARQAGLGREDREDAKQDAVLAVWEVIVEYDLLAAARARQSGQPGDCYFRSFLKRRALSRFHDTLRRLRWLQSRQHGDVQLLVTLEGQSKPIVLDARRRGWRQLEQADPALAAQQRELYERLCEAIAKLDDEDQRIVEQSADGVSIVRLAADVGVSPRTLYRRRDEAYAKLRIELKDWQP
jgi:RNA polymerase sigma factor (sigma-70 family)